MSNTAKAGNASKKWDALDSVRDRTQFDLGQIRLPYTVRVQGWKTWMTPLAFFTGLCCLGFGYLVYPGFSGSFEDSVMNGLILWAFTLGGFGAGIVLIFLVIFSFFEAVVIKLENSWVTVNESEDKPIFREPLANYSGVSLHEDHILLGHRLGTIKKPYYLVDLDHAEKTKSIPLYRGSLKMARERQEQACRVLRLPKVGGDFEHPGAE